MPVGNRGKIKQFEDFGVTAIGDLPEIDVLSATGVTTAILANIHGGAVEIPMGTSNDDDAAAISFGALTYHVAESDLAMETRLRVETITDPKYFIGFGDSIASSDETSFSATTDTVTLDTMTDAAGFLFDNDATTKVLWSVAGATDAVTVGVPLAAALNPAADVWHTFRVEIARGGKSIRWVLDGKEVHTAGLRQENTQFIGAAATLVPGVWNYEQATAADIEVDYLCGEGYRDE